MGKHIPLWALPPFLPVTFSGGPYPFLFIPVSSFGSFHSGLFMPENFVFRLFRTPSYHLVMRNTYRFWKETRFKFFNFKIIQELFCLFNCRTILELYYILYLSCFCKSFAHFPAKRFFSYVFNNHQFFPTMGFLVRLPAIYEAGKILSHIKSPTDFVTFFQSLSKKHSVKLSTGF